MASYGGGEYAHVPHPYLQKPLLYVTGLLPHVNDNDLARALEACVPFRPSIPRDTGAPTLSGTIEFKSIDKAEKALATLQSRQIPGTTPPAYLVLTPYAPNSDATLPPPAAQPRLVKQLPPGYTDAMVYDLFRPFGPLASVRIQQGQENAVLEFWREEDAARAQDAMHCAEVGERNISVQLYQPRRGAEFSASAPPFVPSGSYSVLNSPPRAQQPFMHGPGQQVQYAPPSGPGSQSHSGLIDPCNLFIKNLDADIDSNGLFSHFRHYGHIVSARVMRDDRGNSRGFGFVSYQMPDQAARAMAAMNNARVGEKHVVVRLHEPKQLRQEKLAARYSGGGSLGNGHPRNSSGATSPTLSDDGNFSTYNGWPSPGRQAPTSLAEQTRKVSGGAPMGQERQRRSSGSYYHAALAGTLNLPMRYEELAALSTVVRREVISGELARRLKEMRPPIPQADIDATVDSLAGLPIQEVLDLMDSPALLGARARGEDIEIEVPPAPSRGTSADSRSVANNPATASAPEHPSTPASISTPPRTSSPSGSLSAGVTQRLSPPTNIAPAASERDRMGAAVGTLERDAARADAIVDMLLTLSKGERAKILFSREVLRAKVEEARLILDTVDATEDEPAPPPPATPAKKKSAAPVEDSPQTPALSSRGPSAVASPETPATPPPVNAAKNLAGLSAKEILTRVRSAGLPNPDPTIVKESDVFVDSLTSRDVTKQKQIVGEKLFKIVKAFDSRAAPKVTISLLDTEDLRSLVHLMNEYPSVLREKVTIVAAQIAQSKK